MSWYIKISLNAGKSSIAVPLRVGTRLTIKEPLLYLDNKMVWFVKILFA